MQSKLATPSRPPADPGTCSARRIRARLGIVSLILQSHRSRASSTPGWPSRWLRSVRFPLILLLLRNRI